jgi:nitrite reductase/ring-hydroxylating ferredoxin subunit
MGLFKRILGLCSTPRPADAGCWQRVADGIEVDLARAPELAQPGGAVRLEGRGLPVRVLVVRGEGGTFRAYRNQCTHLGGRRLDPLPGTSTLCCCSVGQSVYDAAGKNVSGPAPKPIAVFPVEERGGKLRIQLAVKP